MDLIRFEIRCVSHDRRRDVLTATQIKQFQASKRYVNEKEELCKSRKPRKLKIQNYARRCL